MESKRATYSQMKMKGSLYFYNGSSYPRMYEECPEELMKQAKYMIALGLRHGVSMDEQTNDYFIQLGIMEDALLKYDGNYTEKNMKKIADSLGQDEDKIFITWILNVCALVIMKRLPDNDMHGVMTIS